MFGKLHIIVAGVVATGLLAVGAPASAASVTAPAPVTAGSVSDLVNVRIVRADSPAVAADPVAAEAAAAAANPYVVIIQNRTTDRLDIKVYWVQSNVNGSLNTGGPVAGGAQYAFRLGGNEGCKFMMAYIVEVYYEGQLVAGTDIIEPAMVKDNYPCADVWDVNVQLS